MSIGLFVAAIIIALAAVLQSEKLLPRSSLLACAILVALAGVGLDRWRQVTVGHDEHTAIIRQALNGTTEQGRLPVARSVPLEDLGVVNATIDIPYLKRDIEDQATEVLSRGSPLLIVGSGLTGKTRLAAELIRQNYPDRDVVIPVDAGSLRDLLKKVRIEHKVVWLDNLDRYLTDDSLDTQLVRDLVKKGNAVLATIDASKFGSFQSHDGTPGYRIRVLESFHSIQLRNRRRENTRHAREAKCEQDDADLIREYGIAGYVGGLPTVKLKLIGARMSNSRSFLLARTLFVWQKTGLTRIHQSQLLKLMNALQGTREASLTVSDINDAVTFFDGPESMPKVVVREADYFRLPGYVVDFMHDEQGGIPPEVWKVAIDVACIHELPLIGHLALVHYRRSTVAERAWRKAADAGDSYSMYNLGLLLSRNRARRAEAAEWLEKASCAGCVDAYEAFASVLLRMKRTEEGLKWLRLAASNGSTSAMIRFGDLLEKQDAQDDALSWYQRAATIGSSDAEYKIAQLLRRKGKRDAADRILVQSHDPRAINALVMIGLDAYWRGEVEVAAGKYMQAAAKKSAWAKRELALMQLSQGDIRSAAESYRGAANAGDGCAMTGLGYIAGAHLEDEALAERWWRRAAQYGCAWAMCYLGTIYERRGEYGWAEFWYRGAAKNDNSDGMYHLGVMLEERFEYDAASRWYEKAAQRGHVVAASDLASMLASQGQDAQANEWSERADILVECSLSERTFELPFPMC